MTTLETPQLCYICQPDEAELCALCSQPVTVFHPPDEGFLETCLICGIVIQRPYHGSQDEAHSLCDACDILERTD